MSEESTTQIPGAWRRRITFNRVRAFWFPIILLESYLAATVFVFFWGPIDWAVPNVPKLVLFLFVNYGGLWLGYSWGIRKHRRAVGRTLDHDVDARKMPTIVTKILLFSMVFAICSYLLRLYGIRGDLDKFLTSFIHPGEAYRESQLMAQLDRDGQIMPASITRFAWVFRLSTLLGVFNSLYFPVGLICWRRIGAPLKLLFLLTVGCNIVYAVGMGTQSGIAWLVFASLPVAIYRLYVSGKPLSVVAIHQTPRPKKRRVNPMVMKSLIAALICCLITTLAFFQLNRAEDTGRELDPAKDIGGPYASNADHGFIKVTGGRFNYGIVMVCQYVSHGYQGLALAMELPFQWTYGLGWSKALQVFLHDYLGGPDVFKRSYLVRNEARTDWTALVLWSTIFPWIASDTTFYGTVVVVILIGFAIGRCWMHVIMTGNPIGFAVLAQLFILIFMFPANNALAQTLEGLFSLIGLVLLYIASWRYFKPVRLPIEATP